MNSIDEIDFEANCLEILEKFERREIEKLLITRNGEVFAALALPESDEAATDTATASDT